MVFYNLLRRFKISATGGGGNGGGGGGDSDYGHLSSSTFEFYGPSLPKRPFIWIVRSLNRSSVSPYKKSLGDQSSKTKSEDAKRKLISEVKPTNHGEQKMMKNDKPSTDIAAIDSLGDARRKVQEEITREFAVIMATGTLRMSDPAV
ncbi:uncharacterized protein LOC132617956 [Lycium barbarum]|uniref:uncharacterized protein LOC132617956 n=1 Tax=Lycium barbarum TaxID=112863 RepID=UPI00293E8F65|nr:uncharacterized protein LOC132617956 [Lycium barbarum]